MLEQNSSVVFDMPIETITYLPFASGWPCALSGRIANARLTPAASCAAGTIFEPFGYSPPWNWLRYSPGPRSFSGVAAEADIELRMTKATTAVATINVAVTCQRMLNSAHILLLAT